MDINRKLMSSGNTKNYNDVFFLNTLLKHKLNSGDKFTFVLTGDDHLEISACAMYLLEEGHRVILFPFEWESKDINLHYNYLIVYSNGNITVQSPLKSNEERQTIEDMDLVYYTSGSTGTPKPIGVTYDQLKLTANWYIELYNVTESTTICTSLPSTYNFTFVAGVVVSFIQKCKIYIDTNIDNLLSDLPKLADDGNRVILLANPLILEWLASSKLTFIKNLLIDTGGAPLSCEAINRGRTYLGDIREGYGLTETCSLTHFDHRGDSTSIGTVGAKMDGVDHEIRIMDSKPHLYIKSPNQGVNLNQEQEAVEEELSFINTGDLGHVDQNGHLRILGRQEDTCINGFWPRDTLDIIGPVLGFRCALIKHLENREVQVKLWGEEDEVLTEIIEQTIIQKLSIPKESIRVLYVRNKQLHSVKIPRK